MSGLPKIIHMAWFGPGELTDLNKRCIESWREIMPRYEIRVWNEENLPGVLNDTQMRYYKGAIEGQFWANASNLVRMVAMDLYGGIYLDTDVELLKPLDLDYQGEDLVVGWESPHFVNNAIMYGQPGNWPVKEIAKALGTNVEFRKKIGARNTRTNMFFDGREPANFSGPWLITKAILDRGFEQDHARDQTLHGVRTCAVEKLYPVGWHERKSLDRFKEEREKAKAYTLHWWEGTWITDTNLI